MTNAWGNRFDYSRTCNFDQKTILLIIPCGPFQSQISKRSAEHLILSIISDNCQKGVLSATFSTKITHLRMAGLSLGGGAWGLGIYPSYFYTKKKKELKNLPADYLIPHLLIADIQRVTCNLSNCPGILLIMKSLCTSQNVGADWVCKNNATLLLMGPNSNRSITFTLQ